MKVEELKNYFKIGGLKVTGTKKELVARVFAPSENGIQPVKTAVEIESDLITGYKNKLKIDGFLIPGGERGVISPPYWFSLSNSETLEAVTLAVCTIQ